MRSAELRIGAAVCASVALLTVAAGSSSAESAAGAKGRGTVGTLTLVTPNLWINNALVTRPTPLPGGATVRSDRDGTGTLILKLKQTTCALDRSSSATVQPSPSVLVLFQALAGEVQCTMKSKSKKNVTLWSRQGQRITSHDPTFALVVRPRKTVVKVLRGAVTVQGTGGPKKAVTVTAGHQTTVAPRSDPKPAAPLALTPHERGNFARIGTQTPGAKGGVLLGLTGNAARFRAETGQISNVRQAFLGWGQGASYGAPFATLLRTFGPVPMLHLGTAARGNATQAVTPGSIALGKGDDYLIALNRALAAWGKGVYIRPLAEMNNSGTAWAAYAPNGSPKGPEYAPATYRKAFARIFLIVHGGPTAAINARLAALGLPPVAAGDLTVNPFPRVRVLWSPLASATPNIPANAPTAYYPGDGYVDVVGASIFDEGGVAPWDGLERLAAFATAHRKPFSVPEWGLRGLDDPAFVSRMCSFLRAHGTTETAEYFEGKPGSDLSLASKPRSKAAYRSCITPLGSDLPPWTSGGGSTGAGGPARQLRLSVTADPAAGGAPLEVGLSLDASLSVPIAAWLVAFGDGTQTSGRGEPPSTISHTYAADGIYNPTLAVFARAPFTAAAARFLAQATVTVGTAGKPLVGFVPSQSADHKVVLRLLLGLQQKVTGWQIAWGDDKVDTHVGAPRGSFAGHTYAQPGTYRVILTVSTGAGTFLSSADVPVS
jgi:hypothetical protein